MHTFYKDIADLCLSNDGDPIWNGHKYTNQYSSPHIANNTTLFLLVLLVKMSFNVIVSKTEIEIVKSWRNTDGCRTIVFPLPYKLAEKYHIEKPARLYLIPRQDGILLKKVDLEGIE